MSDFAFLLLRVFFLKRKQADSAFFSAAHFFCLFFKLIFKVKVHAILEKVHMLDQDTSKINKHNPESTVSEIHSRKRKAV